MIAHVPVPLPGAEPLPDALSTALDEAAVLLLATPGQDAQRLLAARTRLAHIEWRPADPEWIRDAITTATGIMDDALAGVIDTANAVQRASVLLELAMLREPPIAAEPGGEGEALLAPDAARELFPEFLAESLEYLAQVERALLQLETDAASGDAVNVVFRAFHTMKSTAAFLGLEPIATLAHAAESLLTHIRDGRAAFARTTADLLLETADLMRQLLEQARLSMTEGRFIGLPPAYHQLRGRLAQADHHLATGKTSPAVGESLPQPAPAAAPTAVSADSWVRVRTQRLDELLDLVGELVVAQSMVAGDPRVAHDRQGTLAVRVLHTSKIVRDLQDLSMSLRMVPLRPLFQRMQRLVRDVARQAGKEVHLVTEGEDTEIDRTMVEVIGEPLVHMVRNAIDHGLEASPERVAAGKPAAGMLSLRACHAHGSIVIELRDDGRGLDRERIIAKATARGLVAPGVELTDSEVYELIFAPGLSTAGTVTELSGRGVGMDVVRRSVEQLRGRIEIDSSFGLGTTFTLRLPLTLAITDGMLVRVGSERYILPTTSIVTSFRPVPESLHAVPGGAEFVLLQHRTVPLVRLHHLYGIADAVSDPTRALLVVVAEGVTRYALLVDELLGQQQFVAKSIRHGVGAVPGVAGAAILPDGQVGLILDPGDLFAAARRLAPSP